ncbi:MAG: hypothetical protein U1E77_18855 [Inhella sp.]
MRFDKLGTPKHLIQQRLQVQPRAPGTATEGLKSGAQGEARTALELPLDAALHAQVPLLKSAFDDNAALRLNRPAAAFAFRAPVHAPRPTALYALSELRAACAQVLAVQQQIEPGRLEGKRCVGVSLAFARGKGTQSRARACSRPIRPFPWPPAPARSTRAKATASMRWWHCAGSAWLKVLSCAWRRCPW